MLTHQETLFQMSKVGTANTFEPKRGSMHRHNVKHTARSSHEKGIPKIYFVKQLTEACGRVIV